MISASKIWIGLAAAGMVAASVGTAYAVPSYGDLASPPGYYAGSGPANGNFTIDTSNGIEVGLRAKDRETVTSIDGSSGIYHARTGLCMAGSGFCGGVTNKALWNYEFSVNTSASGLGLGAYRIEIRVDTDPGAGTTFTTLDVYTNWADNEFVDIPDLIPAGVCTSTNEAGERCGAGPLGLETSVQQSANPLFANSGFMPGFNPFANGTYEIEIGVFLASGGPELAGTSITVQVPEPGTVAMLGLGLAGLGFARRRKQIK